LHEKVMLKCSLSYLKITKNRTFVTAYFPDNMKKIVIAIDSFKGCLTSAEAGEAAAQGVHAACPECRTIVLPVADGGEGMLDVLLAASNGKRITVRAHDPLMQPCDASYGISGDGNTAFVEMAAISGLPLVPADKRNPMKTTTFGTGELIRDALERGCLRFVIGLGGSATNDAGLGMLQALGFRFFDKEGHEVGSMEKGIALCGALLSEISSIDSSSAHPALKKACFTAACDVRNPFFGPNGAAHIFAPQKGADADMVKELDVAMQHLSDVIFHTTGKDVSLHPGAGAAGGMGGSLHAFLDAQLKPGIELLLETLDFAEKIKDADLIITGEGKSDRQTLMGKVPSGILQEARRQHIPVILLAGAIEDTKILNEAGFRGVFSITPSPVSLEQAMQPEFAQDNIRRTVEQICRIMP
jgi:glycerate kinase